LLEVVGHSHDDEDDRDPRLDALPPVGKIVPFVRSARAGA